MSDTVTTEQATPPGRLLMELRATGKLLGKLYLLPNGQQVVELVCRGRDCRRLCLFDVETGAEVHLDLRSS